MKLNSFTLLARETVAVLDLRPDLKLSFKEIHDAAERKELVQHLATRYGKDADFSLLTELPDYRAELVAVNHALYEVAGGIYGREPKIGAKNNGLCLVLAIIIEAMQREFPSPVSHLEPTLVEG